MTFPTYPTTPDWPVRTQAQAAFDAAVANLFTFYDEQEVWAGGFGVKALELEAALLASNIGSLTGQAGKLIGVNPAEDGVQFIVLDRSPSQNKIINGRFDHWQRGTSQTTNGYGSADRWLNGRVGTTVTTSRQAFTVGQTDVPGNPEFYSRSLVSSVAGAGNYALMEQRIEDVRTLSGDTVTLTLWAKAAAGRDIAVEFYQNFGSGGSSIVQSIGITKLTLTTSWQKFNVTASIPPITGKTLGAGNYLSARIWFESGSTFDANTTPDGGTALGQQSGTFDIARVSLIEGDQTAVSDPFPGYVKDDDFRRCQRFYQMDDSNILTAHTVANTASWTLPVEMRATPTIAATLATPGGATFLTSPRSFRQGPANGVLSAFTYKLEAEL